MKRGFLGAICCLLLITAERYPCPPNSPRPTPAGVSLGAVYYTVPDVAAHKKIWVDIFGAKPTMVGKTEMLKIPGAFIVLTQGTPSRQPRWSTSRNLGKGSESDSGKAHGGWSPNGSRSAVRGSAQRPAPGIHRRSGRTGSPAAHHIHYFVPNNGRTAAPGT